MHILGAKWHVCGAFAPLGGGGSRVPRGGEDARATNYESRSGRERTAAAGRHVGCAREHALRCGKCSVSRSPRGGHRPAGKYVTYKCPIRPAVVACVARPRRRRAQKTAANRVFHAPGPGAAGAAAMRGAGTRTSGRGLPAFPCRLGYQPRRQHRRAAAESALFPVPQFFNPESELIRSEPSCGHYS